MGNEREETPSTSRLFEEVYSLARYTHAKAAFAFVIESDRGDSGCPVFCIPPLSGGGVDTHELKRLQRKLGLILRDIADNQLRQAGSD